LHHGVYEGYWPCWVCEHQVCEEWLCWACGHRKVCEKWPCWACEHQVCEEWLCWEWWL
jgi:hypothetical protein